MPNAPRTFGSQKQQGQPRKPWQKRHGFKRRLTGERLQKTKERILERDEYECQNCFKLVDYDTSILDHITPLSQGGTDYDSNLQTLCKRCSDAKTGRESGQARGNY